jgi:hypothetical protein
MAEQIHYATVTSNRTNRTRRYGGSLDTPAMTSANGLICFTNCLLPQEDGSLIEKNLWIDERRGVILDAQVLPQVLFTTTPQLTTYFSEPFTYEKKDPTGL